MGIFKALHHWYWLIREPKPGGLRSVDGSWRVVYLDGNRTRPLAYGECCHNIKLWGGRLDRVVK